MTRTHTVLIIAALALLSAPACAVLKIASVQPTRPRQVAARASRTPIPTFTPTVMATATPTLTLTATPTATATPTEPATPAPTALPAARPSPASPGTATPEATNTRAPARAPRPAQPTESPTPAATATPQVDFIVTKQDVMPVVDSGGYCMPQHTIFVTVVDANDQPIDGLVVTDKYNTASFTTGEKGPGHVEFDLWKNSLELFIKSDQSGNPVRSQTTRRLSSDKPEISDMIQGGVCKDEAACQARIAASNFCFGHYAYQVTFKRTW